MSKTFNLTGTAYWAKVLGDPVENYLETANEWTIDVTPDQRGLDLLRRLGLGEKLRNKDDDRGDFITFRRNELSKKDNTPNDPIEIVDADGQPWDTSVNEEGLPNKPIGNGSTVKVRFSVFDMPAKGKFKAIIKPVIYKVTVLEWVEFKKHAKITDGQKAKSHDERVQTAGTSTSPVAKKRPAAVPKKPWETEIEEEAEEE